LGVQFAGKDCVDPRDVLRECVERRIPTNDWAGKPTSFRTSIRKPGIGHVLLSRKTLKDIPETEPHTLQFEFNGKSFTFKKVWISETRCVTPGYEQSDESVYLCDLVDYRHFLNSIWASAAYNLRDSSGNLNVASLNSGSQWTWSGMLGNLWAKSGELGTFPGLPSGLSPHGNPNHFDYSTSSLLAAILHACDRLGLAFQYDPFADKYSLARIGQNPASLPADLEMTWNEYRLNPDNASEPKEIQTVFRRLPASSSLLPTIKKATVRTAKTGMLSTTAVVLNDDLTASVDSDAALASRATDRAAEWERIKASVFATDTLTIYAGLADLVKHLGTRYEEIAWSDRGAEGAESFCSDRGGGWYTEVKSGSVQFLEDWTPSPIQLAGGNSGSSPPPPPLSTRAALTNVECDAIGFISKTYSVFYGPALEVAPSGPYSIAGSVSVSGTPTAGRIVVITYGGYEWQITTDGSGNYLLDEIPGGPYVATVVVSGTETSQTRAVTLSSALTGFNFTVTP
jgi:hypothetical protein